MSNVSSYSLEIEFETGSFTHVSDDVLSMNINLELSDMITGVNAGECVARLNNQNGQYSSGALSSLVRPNLAFRVQATHQGSERRLFNGFIDEWSFNSALSGPREATLSGRDAIKQLQDRTVVTSLFVQTDITSTFAEILDQVAPNSYSVAAHNVTVPFVWFQEIPALDAITQMMGIDHSYMHVCPYNCIQILRKYFDVSSPTVTDSIVGVGSLTMMVLESRSSDDAVLNRFIIETVPRETTVGIRQLTKLPQPVSIPPSGHVSFNLDYVDPDNREPTPANSFATLTASRDWQASFDISDTTNAISVTSLTASLLSASVVASFFNGSDQTVYITKFRVLGNPLQRDSPLITKIDQTSSQSIYGELEFTHSNELIGLGDLAADLGTWMGFKYAFPAPSVIAVFRNDFPRNLDTRIANVVHLQNSFLSTASNYFVRGLEHTIDAEAGWIHDMGLVLELQQSLNLLILDESDRGKMDDINVIG